MNEEKRRARKKESHPNWKGGHWNKGSIAYWQTRLSTLRGHARKGNFAPPMVTAEELAVRFQKFNKICPICFAHEDDFCLDHNHETGAIRNFICRRCNHLLGCARDNPVVLDRAINYLTKGGIE